MPTINLNIELNKNRGVFSGEFNLTEAVNSYYNDYEGSSISNLSIAASPILGSVATVRVKGGSIASSPFPTTWQVFGDAITTNTGEWNIITIMYISANDIRVVNNTSSIPLTYSEIITDFAVLALDSSLIDLSDPTNIRSTGGSDYLINWIDQSTSSNDANQSANADQYLIDSTDLFLTADSTDHMDLGATTTFTGSTGFSAYFVLDKDNTENLQVIMGKTGNSSLNIFTTKIGGDYFMRFFDGSNLISLQFSGVGDLSGKKIYEINHDGSGTAQLYVNGTLTDTQVGAPNVDYSYDIIGARDIGNNLTGDIYGIFNFSYLNSTYRDTVRTELASKYGITL